MARFDKAAAIRMLKDIFSGPLPAALALSPDGRRIAVVTARTDWKSNAVRHALLLRCEGKLKRRMDGASPIRAPRWTCDGKALLFLAQARPRGSMALFRWDPARTRPQRIATEPGGITGFALGRGRRIYYVAAPPPESAKPSTVHYPLAVRRAQLKVFPGRRRVAEIPADVAGLTVSADGRFLAYTARPTPYPEAAFQSELYVLDLAGGKTRRVGKPRWMAQAPAFSPTRPHLLAVIARVVPGVYPSRSDIFLLDIRSGALRNLTGRRDEQISDWLSWNPDGTALLSSVMRGTELHAVAYDLQGNPRTIAAGYAPYAAAGKDGSLHCLVGDAQGPARVWDTRRPYPASRVRCCRQEVARWRTGDGREIEGVLVLPRGGRAPYATVLFVHGGPVAPVINCPARMEWCQVLAAAGLAVLAPAFRGSAGYGHEFIRASVGDFARGPARDMMSGLDALIRAGVADRDRLAIMGSSYGGYLTLWMCTQTRRFKAALCASGIYDLASDAGTTLRGPFAARYLGKPCWDAPLLHLDHSASGHVRKLRTPLLMLHGEADTNTPLSNAKEAAYALRNLGREFRFKSYAGEGHGFSQPRTRMDAIGEFVDWLNRCL